MESERRPADIGESVVVAGQAHRRIDMLLDKVSELTTERDRWREQANEDASKFIDAAERATAAARERDEWMRSHTELGRQLARERDAVNGRLDHATNRALDEVIAALAGWVEGVQSNCEATGHKDCDCANEFSVDDIRNMIEDARRQLGAERDFDTVIDSDALEVERSRAEQFERDAVAARRERDAAVATLNRQGDALAQTIRERDEARRSRDAEIQRYNAVAERAEKMVRSAEAERDEARAERDRASAAVEQVLRLVGHTQCTTNCGGATHVVHDSQSVASLVMKYASRYASGAVDEAAKSLRADRDDAIERAEQFERERDEARAQLAARTRDVRIANGERDNHRAQLIRETERVNKVVIESQRLREQRDHANATVANLRSVLSSIVKSIDSQEPKSCNCGATSLLPLHTDPKCPHHGDDAS